MKSQFFIFLAVTILIFSCTAPKLNTSPCEPMMCTQEFRMVQVKFKDSSGKPLTVKDFSAINKRTGESTVQNNEPVTVINQGIYTVASDADLKKLSETGDIIIVTASHPRTNEKISADFVVSGGKCACHINKISGPAEVTL
ncbi:hypothetical protein [Daejeonella sp.]|uniref:hypothetical protein n=1 Tax=Daejeonella sp. TaxID=2805397 RepID=UPI003982DB9F